MDDTKTRKCVPGDHEKLMKLKGRMDRVNFWFHPWRNNMRSVNRFYTAFISIFGYERWECVLPQIRVAWEAARLDFDKMLGLIRGWQDLEDFYGKEASVSKQDMVGLAAMIHELTESVRVMKPVASMQNSMDEFQKKAKELTDQLDTIQKSNALYQEVYALIDKYKKGGDS